MIRLTHNGMTVKFFETEVDANKYMQESREKSLNSKLLVENTEVDDEQEPVRKVVIYQYNTLYSEMFLLEYQNY